MKKSLGTIILSAATALMLAGCCAKGGTEAAPLPDKGEVLLNGKPLTLQDTYNIGYLPEERGAQSQEASREAKRK